MDHSLILDVWLWMSIHTTNRRWLNKWASWESYTQRSSTTMESQCLALSLKFQWSRLWDGCQRLRCPYDEDWGRFFLVLTKHFERSLSARSTPSRRLKAGHNKWEWIDA
eukprot:Blabericola_migrator_1__10403@NODE_587_length_7461_cov_69_370571_g434_i0_p5_GENE_NODE_587_length_7461_cov_69_370571_g434_i0NODE_587_length_7461_cov_69_370571_g434_i0_p5_ORF_typecomplete_len109_score9_49MIF4G_like/PF09088_11/2_NODE_587_length_7461_cov_69_370571_g434_i034143740